LIDVAINLTEQPFVYCLVNCYSLAQPTDVIDNAITKALSSAREDASTINKCDGDGDGDDTATTLTDVVGDFGYKDSHIPKSHLQPSSESHQRRTLHCLCLHAEHSQTEQSLALHCRFQ
jgi:hypothetical protein